MYAALGVGMYIMITYLIDSNTRRLVQSIIKEIKTKA